MNQKYKIGERVTFSTYDFYWNYKYTHKNKYSGTVVGYNEQGYFPNRLALKRYKVKEDLGGIIFLGENRLKKLKE